MTTPSQKVPLKIWILVIALVLGAIILTHPVAALEPLQESDIGIPDDLPGRVTGAGTCIPGPVCGGVSSPFRDYKRR